RSGGAPAAVTLNVALLPFVAVTSGGWTTIEGASSTVVTSVAGLFVGAGSKSGLVTVAEFVRLPAALGTTSNATVAAVAGSNASSRQVTWPALLSQTPCEGSADTKVTPAGNTSVTATSLATEGPALVTVIV